MSVWHYRVYSVDCTLHGSRILPRDRRSRFLWEGIYNAFDFFTPWDGKEQVELGSVRERRRCYVVFWLEEE